VFGEKNTKIEKYWELGMTSGFWLRIFIGIIVVRNLFTQKKTLGLIHHSSLGFKNGKNQSKIKERGLSCTNDLSLKTCGISRLCCFQR